MEEEKEMSAEESQSEALESKFPFWKSPLVMFVGGAFVGLVLIVVGAVVYFTQVKGLDVRQVFYDYAITSENEISNKETLSDPSQVGNRDIASSSADKKPVQRATFTSISGEVLAVGTTGTDFIGEYIISSWKGSDINLAIKTYINANVTLFFDDHATVVDEQPFISQVTTSSNIAQELCASKEYQNFCDIDIYIAGKAAINGQEYILYHLFTPFFAPGPPYHDIAIFDQEEKRFVLINGNNTYNLNFGDGQESRRDFLFSGHILHDVPDDELLESEVYLPDKDITIKFVKYLGSENYSLSPYKNIGGITDIKGNKIFSLTDEYKISFKDLELGNFYQDPDTGAYYNIGFHGAVRVFDVVPNFYIDNNSSDKEKSLYRSGYKVDITWNKTNNVSDDFYLWAGDIGGFCSGIMKECTNVVDKKPWFDENDLVAVGKINSTEEFVYELKNKKTNDYYQDFFNVGYAGYLFSTVTSTEGLHIESVEKGKENDSPYYHDFLDDIPLFFWKDPFDNWRSYRKIKYQSLAECGKPVIYLYPEEAMDVNVQVEPNGGFTKVEPEYPEGGWTVHATPESEIYNYADETTYPYLFWEGHASNYERPKQGFVLAKDEVPAKMRELLVKLGLNEKESEDFLEFWQERLMVKDYVFVTFLDQAEFDKLVPLTVSPAPDTVIRVFMDYSPLDEAISVQPLAIKTPERSGFTVVEWGGALQ